MLFANLIFEECNLSSGEGSAGIIEVEECTSGRIRGAVRLHHVNFNGNQMNSSVAVSMNTETCSSLEMIDVQFDSNNCIGICGAILSTETVLRNVRLQENTQTGQTSGIPALLYGPPDSQISAEEIAASNNDGAVMFVEDGQLGITDASFVQNEVDSAENGDPVSASIHLINSVATIRRCEFEENSAISGAALYAVGSTVTLRNSNFEGNSGTDGGAAVYLLNCDDVNVRDCSFTRNSVPTLDGAGILSNNTESLTVRRSTFSENSAGTGAGLYALNGSTSVRDCTFQDRKSTRLNSSH